MSVLKNTAKKYPEKIQRRTWKMIRGLRKKLELGLTDWDSHDFVGFETTGADFHGFNRTFK